MTALLSKLSILADAAKYDASCASSGASQRSSRGGKGIGSAGGMGICHSYAPDGRCISLLKLLLTNFCIYDCQYCVNRASSPVTRARFSVEEVVQLTLDFYKRNYIEGLFLSSGIIQNDDYTMEQLIAVAKSLRLEHDFRGYIHLKTLPDASPELIREAGCYADRLSINIELPSRQSLQRLAPEKNFARIHSSMGNLREHIDESKESRKKVSSKNPKLRVANRARNGRFVYAPAGQSTQMIVGADDTNDTQILSLSTQLYDRFHMRRVYYSAYSPIPSSAKSLPATSPPLVREHRLYQADWLLRFYGYRLEELAAIRGERPGMLDLDIDPKLAWALQNRDFFPMDINRASREALLRIPGIGPRSADRIVQSRRFHTLRWQDLARLSISLKKVAPFVCTLDHQPKSNSLESESLRQKLSRPVSPQLSLF